MTNQLLTTIEDLASKCGFHQLHIESLTMLALDTLQKQDAKKYFLHAADIAKIQLNDPILSYEKLKLGLKDSDDPVELLRLARSAFDAGNLNHANHIASTFLRDPRCLETTDLSIEFCTILNQSDETKSLATNIIQTLISWSETSGLTEYTAKLITFAVKNSLASKALLQREIVRQASINNLDTATFYLVKWLQKIDSQRDSLPQLVDVLRDDFSSIGHLEFWCKLLEETSKEHNLIKLSGVARQEILIRYSQWLQESERDRQKTLSVFFDIYRENPNEVRIWVPLYLLLEEINDDRRLIPLLDRIIPRVESKPEIIDKYPINVETMKASLRRARTRAVLKKDDFQLQEPEVLKEELSKPGIVQTRDDKVKVIQQEIMDHIPLINFQFSNSIPEDSQSGAQSFLKDEEAPPQSEDPSKSMNLSSSFTKSEASTINGSSIESLTAVNWREFIRPGLSELPVNLSKMKTSDFKSEEERHIFLQAIFLCTGNAHLLKKMIWRPWRNPLDFGYSIVDKRRQTHDTDNVMFKTERGRNLSVLSTPLSRQMRNRVLIDFYLKSKNPLAKLKMNTVSHGHEIIQRTALRFFVEKLGNEKYFFVDTPEIGDKIFVDPIAKSIHFSIESIAKFQPSYFFHQVAIQTSILKSEHFYLLNAKIPQEFLPLLQYVRGYRPPSKIDKIRDTLKPDQNKIEYLFDGLDIKKIQTLIQNIGHLDQSDLEIFQFEILRYHLRKQLASTLDLVGIIESMTGLDLEKSGHEDIKRVIKKNPQIIDLIKYCTKLE
ncbi:MAG: hypothetical protein NT027_02990, partial [Proteobacteria bacterium]|nr:hypothetical protein [Pseudomonadota bacterium]